MKIFISACAMLILAFSLVFLGSLYCEKTVNNTISALTELEDPGNFSSEKAEKIYSSFEKRANKLRYFTVADYIDDVLVPLSELRCAKANDSAEQRKLIEEACIKLERLRVAGTFSFAAIL